MRTGNEASDDSVLEELYDACVDRLMRGEDVDLDALCERHPAHAAALREHLTALREAAKVARTTKRPSSRQAARAPLLADSGLPFDRLGEFRLIRLLGRGGMGAVYLAEQEFLGRLVALKVIRPELVGFSAAKGRFDREVDAVAKLRHPNIVTVYSAGEDKGVPYLVMELVPGRGLDEMIEQKGGKPLPLPLALKIGAQIARALHCAHEQGVLHRDVKPSNIRITPDERALLLDFGLARSKESASITKTGEFQGTPNYVAPEQIGGKFDAQDGRLDVFALGVTLYECVTGRLPFPGQNVEEVLRRILFDEPESPRASNPLLKRDVETVLQKALEKDPARRYANAREFAEDLEALLALAPIKARPPGPMRRAGQWMRRNPFVSLATAAVVVLGCGFGVARWNERMERRQQAVALVGEWTSMLEAKGYTETDALFARASELDPGNERVARDRQSMRHLYVQGMLGSRAEQTELDTKALLEVRTTSQRAFDALRVAMGERVLTPAEEKQFAALDLELAAMPARVDELEDRMRGLVDEAARIDVDMALGDARARIDAAHLEFWMHRWRAAVAERDESAAAQLAPRVARLDAARKYADELAGLGSVAFTVSPANARVHLFRYVDQRSVVKDGEPRLVPIAVRSFTPPRPYGAWVLRVVQEGQGLRPGDTITKVAGQPVRNTVLVERGAGDVARFDKLVSIDGHPIRDAFEAWYHEQLPAKTSAGHAYVFARPVPGQTEPQKIALEAASLAEAGIEVASPARLVELGDVPVEAYTAGKVAPMTLADGVAVRATGAPFYAAEATIEAQRGAAPGAYDWSLEHGSYVAIVEADGCEAQRVPFVVERQGRSAIAVELAAVDTTPSGFVFVPGGPFAFGGDLDVDGAVIRATADVAPFWIQEREVTFAEYGLFLNSPRTHTRFGAKLGELAPRVVGDARDSVLERSSDGTFVVPAELASLPVYGVGFDAAQAYAEWVTERERAAGSTLTFDLPSSLEWEKAARGVDGRTLVCGNHFVASWLKSRHARPVTDLEPVLSFPVDESPYGAFDLGGSLNEWCKDVVPESPDLRIVRGGAWNAPRAQSFHAAYRHFVRAPTMASSIGFRLVARA
ncbi:MAG: protein kinase [Planctomycetes bacterium]|nr:protein kinase [Planctomycetota bacterium]